MSKEENHIDKKEEILRWLRELGRIPTSRFIGLIGSNYAFIIKLLDELESAGKIKKEVETNAVYWSVIPNE